MPTFNVPDVPVAAIYSNARAENRDSHNNGHQPDKNIRKDQPQRVALAAPFTGPAVMPKENAGKMPQPEAPKTIGRARNAVSAAVRRDLKFNSGLANVVSGDNDGIEIEKRRENVGLNLHDEVNVRRGGVRRAVKMRLGHAVKSAAQWMADGSYEEDEGFESDCYVVPRSALSPAQEARKKQLVAVAGAQTTACQLQIQWTGKGGVAAAIRSKRLLEDRLWNEAEAQAADYNGDQAPLQLTPEEIEERDLQELGWDLVKEELNIESGVDISYPRDADLNLIFGCDPAFPLLTTQAVIEKANLDRKKFKPPCQTLSPEEFYEKSIRADWGEDEGYDYVAEDDSDWESWGEELAARRAADGNGHCDRGIGLRVGHFTASRGKPNSVRWQEMNGYFRYSTIRQSQRRPWQKGDAVVN